MTDQTLILPDETEVPGSTPVVVLGPNGSGKSREARRLSVKDGSIEVINALRSTMLSQQLPAMSQLQARQQHEGTRNNARAQPWSLVSDFDVIIAQLLAEDGDAARSFRHRVKTGESVTEVSATPLEQIESVWSRVFPGRRLTWQDWAPVVTNDASTQESYTANQMSDGERAALYLLAKLLLATDDATVIVDEPETHLHTLLSVRLWDAIEELRSDLRFVYVTHDLSFALSREPAEYLLAQAGAGLSRVELDVAIPLEVRREILGAASFSYYASRVIFCEGTEGSYDQIVLRAWCGGRDTVVVPVGSRSAVRECKESFNRAALVMNLTAVGVVDRDFSPTSVLDAMGPGIVVLPFHEIEGLLCRKDVADRLAQHLGLADQFDAERVVKQAIRADVVARVAHERAKLRILNAVENVVNGRPGGWDEESLRSHAVAVDTAVADATNAQAIFEEELAQAKAVADGDDVAKILELFPSKPIAGAVAAALRSQVPTLFGLIAGALKATDPEDPLASLGRDLVPLLESIGLPARQVADRAVIQS